MIKVFPSKSYFFRELEKEITSTGENIEHDTNLDNYGRRVIFIFFSSHNIRAGENVEVGIMSSEVRVMFFDLIPLAQNVQ